MEKASAFGLSTQGYVFDPTCFRSFKTGDFVEKILKITPQKNNFKFTIPQHIYIHLQENNTEKIFHEVTQWTYLNSRQQIICKKWLSSNSFQSLREQLLHRLTDPNKLTQQKETSAEEVIEISYKKHFGIISFFTEREWVQKWGKKLDEGKIWISIQFRKGQDKLLELIKKHGLEYLLKIINMILHKITNVASGAMAIIAPGSNLLIDLAQDATMDYSKKKLEPKIRKKLLEWYEKADVRVDDP